MILQTITSDEVLKIHYAVVKDFTGSDDPIFPAGIRSQDLLESAISRQFSGSGGELKYSNAIDNAASLLFGICNNHAFYNGNKRTALVSMLVHLDKNKLALFNTSEAELYSLMISVANHTVGLTSEKQFIIEPVRRKADEEVCAIATWLRSRTFEVRRGEKQITYRQLRKILEGFKYSLRYPNGNSISIIKFEEEKSLFKRKSRTIEKRIDSIPYPGDNKFVSVKTIKYVRRVCGLCEENGIDSDAFYYQANVIDEFVNRYRTILRRLAQD